jgi:hypothetical protein
MRYSFRVKGNRRLFVAYGLILLLIFLTAAPLVFLPGIAGMFIAVLFGYFAFQMIRMLLNHVKSFIMTHDDGITLRFPTTSLERLEWDQITHAGIIHTPENTVVRFIYAEGKDRLATIPEEYNRLEDLDEELKAKTPWYELNQEKGKSIQETIRPVTKHADTDEEPEDLDEKDKEISD